SLAQEREWFVAALAPDAPIGNVTLALRLRGPLQPDRLERALGQVVARHDMLRAQFVPVHGRLEVRVSPSAGVGFVRHEPADLAAVEASASALADVPVDLQGGPLVQAHLFPVAGSTE